jgi:predicted nucleotidyltransferase
MENRRLLRIAEECAEQYRDQPHVISILLTGSVAYGKADHASDIDLLVIYEELDAAAYKQIRKEAEGQDSIFILGGREAGFITVSNFVKGIKCDVVHLPQSKIEATIEAVKVNIDSDENLQSMLFGLTYAKVLHGAENIKPLQQKVKKYPKRLATSILNKSLQFTPKWVYYNMVLPREDMPFLYECILDDLRRVYRIICALNNIYHPGKLKGIDVLIRDRIRIAPLNMAVRIDELFDVHPEKSVDLLYHLIDETIVLVREHQPGIDLKPVLERLELVLRKR